ncbi:MAG: hypothetical protein CFH08_02297 [Alphaproteobacteria bacterium MarineAlpha3_Bin7]|nr:MAG: hypothetical protein CFH08_02297 [Alphaproteobacteria bacterium MarineAlpha3_Bin7]
MDLYYWLPLLTIVMVGGIMRGFAGFGTTLIMVPLFCLLMPPSEAVFIALVTDVLVMLPLLPNAVRNAQWEYIWPMVIGVFLATPLGVVVLTVTNPNFMKVLIAILVIGSACLLLSGWKYQGKRANSVSFVIGVFSSITNGATGIGGPPIAVYFIAQGMSAISLRASLNSLGFIMESAAALFIYFAGGVEFKILVTVLILFPFMLLFTWVGSKIFAVLDNSFFNKLILYFLLIFGAYIIVSTIYNGFFSV